MRLLTAAAATLLALSAAADTSYAPSGDHANRVFWGDTHLHTKLSMDASSRGNRNLGPEAAYVVARGGTVIAHNGMEARLRRPLDFLVVADHAENLGVADGLWAADPVLLATETGKRFYGELQDLLADGPTADAVTEFIIGVARPDAQIRDERFRRSIWNHVTAMAEQYNEPGRFTAFIGYEWTSRFEDASRHRVVIFKDGASTVDRILPFSAVDSPDPEELWRFLNRYEELTGGEVLAIAHNSNLSNAREFALSNRAGQPLGLAHLRLRLRWEPLLEVTQIKGDSETNSILSPRDEFADYENWESWAVIDGWPGPVIEDRVDDPDGAVRARPAGELQYEYARSALKIGLDQQAQYGVNPFKFGLIGSTDAHSSLPAVAEDNFWGKHAIVEPYAGRITHPRYRWRMAASGYAAVWARENTREALFAAMKRKETYATTGPRMVVRFFGGWDFAPGDALVPNLAGPGYARGVPMGGDLSTAPDGKAPTFLVGATKDPIGGNLDRVQIVKGWRDAGGGLHERVFNVALSDGRSVAEDGTTSPVGSTVDTATASYTNTIGDSGLTAVWRDPDFDPQAHAFYYVRVLEIPTPRWPAYDARYFGIDEIPGNVPLVTQERAYTSPIWYTP